jgi:hypothetical protein
MSVYVADRFISALFARIVPWLFFGATALFALGTWIKARLRRRARLSGPGWEGLSLLLQFLLALTADTSEPLWGLCSLLPQHLRL